MCESCLLWVCSCLSFLFNFLMLYFYFVLCMPCVSMCVSIQYGWLNYLHFLTHFFLLYILELSIFNNATIIGISHMLFEFNKNCKFSNFLFQMNKLTFCFFFLCYTQQSHHFRSILFFCWFMSFFFVLLKVVKDWNWKIKISF